MGPTLHSYPMLYQNVSGWEYVKIPNLPPEETEVELVDTTPVSKSKDESHILVIVHKSVCVVFCLFWSLSQTIPTLPEAYGYVS